MKAPYRSTEEAHTPESTSDSVSLYMRDVEQHPRLSREEENDLVRDIVRRREEIAELLRAVLLKACDTLGIEEAGATTARKRRHTVADPSATPIESYLARLGELRSDTGPRSTAGKLRAAIAGLADKARLRNLETKIVATADLARNVAKAMTCRPTSNERCRILRDIAASFGVSAEDIQRVAALITESRRVIEQAKRRLVESNLRLVVFFARRARWRGADMSDLIQEGNIALMHAVDSFDPRHGIPFGTFATVGVRRAIHRFGANAAEVVRVPDDVRLRRRRIRGAERHLTDANGKAPTWDEIAAFLELPRSQVAEAFDYAEDTVSLDHGIDETATLANALPDPGAIDAEAALSAFEDERRIRHEIGRLDERARRVIEERYVTTDPTTLADIGRALGVTRERARQIEGTALRTLRARGSSKENAPRRRRRRGAAQAF